MAKTYKRKRITSLEELDREENRLRKKAKQIEQEWAEILDPQQLAISFLTQFIGKKLSRRSSSKASKKDFAYGTFKDEPIKAAALKIKEKKPFIKRAAKAIGITMAALFVAKKFFQIRAERKKKEARVAVQLAPVR